MPKKKSSVTCNAFDYSSDCRLRSLQCLEPHPGRLYRAPAPPQPALEVCVPTPALHTVARCRNAPVRSLCGRPAPPDAHLSARETLPQYDTCQVRGTFTYQRQTDCKDNETYRNSVRQTIRTWYNGVVAKRNQEWLILHVIPKSSNIAGKAGSRFSMKGSVYDKIRADFNSSKKDR
jgi:hypothetical protein